jgi:hypothetical protein
MAFTDPDDLNRFVSEVRTDLQAAGLDVAAQRIATVQSTAFTTGSEWLGELGVAVNAIRGMHTLPADLDAKLERIKVEVRRVWPSL